VVDRDDLFGVFGGGRKGGREGESEGGREAQSS